MKALICSFLFLSLASCGSLKTAPYRAPAEFSPTRNTGILHQGFELTWPMRGARMTRGFAPSWKNHYGIDLAKAKGSPIYAAHSGVVVYVSRGQYRGYGKLVIIEHPSGWGSMYAHCHQIFVKKGQIIEIGERIASVGNTGNARGVHLHFELRKNKKAVDPLKYLP